ncbi:MAG: response regulator transcription factor [Cyanobacteria bacterium]|nr:response regulator transcription factor [Cyanobacteriota bacterium]
MTQDSKPIRVLIVDDQRLTRVSLKTMLFEQRDRIQLVGEAEEGQEAIQLAEQHRPDVILMDIGMPIMDGIQATQAIKSRLPETKIVMLTTHDSEEDILESFRSGATSYCLKETPPEQLIQIIIATAEGACWIDPSIAKVVLKGLHSPPNTSNKSEAALTRTGSSTEPLNLTERECDVLRLITQGKNNQEIADTLCLSLNTVKTHLKNLFQKLNVEDRTAAAIKALKEKLV